MITIFWDSERLDQCEAALVAGLEMAVRKFGMWLEVTRTDEHKKQIALTAAEHGLGAEFTQHAMKKLYQLADIYRNTGLWVRCTNDTFVHYQTVSVPKKRRFAGTGPHADYITQPLTCVREAPDS